MNNAAVGGVAVGAPLAVILFVVVVLGGGATSQTASDTTLTAGLQNCVGVGLCHRSGQALL